MKITRYQEKDLVWYEANFTSGNLLTFSIKEMIEQLKAIHGFTIPIFNFNLN